MSTERCKRIALALSLALPLPLAACGRAPEPRSEPAQPPPEPIKQAPTPPPPQPAPAPPAAQPAPPAGPRNPALLDPSRATERAPARYTVKLETTKGDILIDVHRDWAPTGADRFYNLVRIGYFDDAAFFRVVSGFMAQVGLHGDPQVNTAWRSQQIQDDPRTQSNTRGMVTFAKTGAPNSRTTQFFINFADNSNLDPMGFAPFGRVRDMTTVDALYSGYGDGAPTGMGPAQMRIQTEGNAYLRRDFPRLDYIRRATTVP